MLGIPATQSDLLCPVKERLFSYKAYLNHRFPNTAIPAVMKYNSNN